MSRSHSQPLRRSVEWEKSQGKVLGHRPRQGLMGSQAGLLDRDGMGQEVRAYMEPFLKEQECAR